MPDFNDFQRLIVGSDIELWNPKYYGDMSPSVQKVQAISREMIEWARRQTVIEHATFQVTLKYHLADLLRSIQMVAAEQGITFDDVVIEATEQHKRHK